MLHESFSCEGSQEQKSPSLEFRVGLSGSDYGLGSFLTLSREACGAVIFTLTQETINRIKRDGLAFFDGARQGRGYPSQSYYRYAPWKQTPAPSKWFGDGEVAGSLTCAGFDNTLISRITAGSRSTRAYYSTMSEAELIVLPDDVIAVLAYDG
jgi:hypothetical protein